MVVALLVLGPKRLPEVARSLGRGLAEFRRASSDLRQSLTAPPEKPSEKEHPKPPTKPEESVEGEADSKPQQDG